MNEIAAFLQLAQAGGFHHKEGHINTSNGLSELFWALQPGHAGPSHTQMGTSRLPSMEQFQQYDVLANAARVAQQLNSAPASSASVQDAQQQVMQLLQLQSKQESKQDLQQQQQQQQQQLSKEVALSKANGQRQSGRRGRRAAACTDANVAANASSATSGKRAVPAETSPRAQLGSIAAEAAEAAAAAPATGADAAASGDAPKKRKRGRPALSATSVHPNLVYVRRFRERQKQMQDQLEEALEVKRAELVVLQEEQQALQLRYLALEQVMDVQSDVLQLLQLLRVSSSHGRCRSTPPAAAGAAVQPSCSRSSSSSSGKSKSSEPPAAQELESVVAEPAGSSGDASRPEAPEAAGAAAAEGPLLSPSSKQDEHALLLQACQWLHPVRLYVLRAAVMLQELEMLPRNVSAAAALTAAQACPAAGASSALRLPDVQLTTAAVAAAVSSATAAGSEQAASSGTIAAGLAAAVVSAWEGQTAPDGCDKEQRGSLAVEDMSLIRYPYSVGMYVVTPEPVRDIIWPLNMMTWQIDAGNSNTNAEVAARALWTVIRPQRWRMLMAIWLTMAGQISAVQAEFKEVHQLLRVIGCRTQHKQPAGASAGLATSLMQASSRAGSSAAAAAAAGDKSGPADLFALLDDAIAYATVARQVDCVLLHEDAIFFQLSGALLALLDPLEVGVVFVSCWPYHPQMLAIVEVLLRLGEPPPLVTEA